MYNSEFNIEYDKKDLVNNSKIFIEENVPVYTILANLSRLIYNTFPNTSWAGFYLSNNEQTYLYLGPYQGSLACTKIAFNKGVCGVAAYKKESQLVANVHEFEGHIACSSLSNSEVVVPIIRDDKVVGVIDLDSNLFNNYSLEDVQLLEQIAKELSALF